MTSHRLLFPFRREHGCCLQKATQVTIIYAILPEFKGRAIRWDDHRKANATPSVDHLARDGFRSTLFRRRFSCF